MGEHPFQMGGPGTTGPPAGDGPGLATQKVENHWHKEIPAVIIRSRENIGQDEVGKTFILAALTGKSEEAGPDQVA